MAKGTVTDRTDFGGSWYVECACGVRTGTDGTRNAFTSYIRRQGWRWTREDGWQCPTCVEARDG